VATDAIVAGAAVENGLDLRRVIHSGGETSCRGKKERSRKATL
jgi:hypothetical protein